MRDLSGLDIGLAIRNRSASNPAGRVQTAGRTGQRWPKPACWVRRPAKASTSTRRARAPPLPNPELPAIMEPPRRNRALSVVS
ncbi:hypothetical protein ULF88_09125 [Halopseudomonas pachastrellae]|nr:hypothetical protein [Halopseudomonas pachastrellae]